MIFISHRGNINGRTIALENTVDYIEKALENFDVEIDVWVYNKNLFLGHDIPESSIAEKWLCEYRNKLWVHCKNVEAVEFFTTNKELYNYFWHQEDTLTLTSRGFVWVYPGKQPVYNSIAVLPELNNDNTNSCLGICSDYIEFYKNKLV